MTLWQCMTTVFFSQIVFYCLLLQYWVKSFLSEDITSLHINPMVANGIVLTNHPSINTGGCEYIIQMHTVYTKILMILSDQFQSSVPKTWLVGDTSSMVSVTWLLVSPYQQGLGNWPCRVKRSSFSMKTGFNYLRHFIVCEWFKKQTLIPTFWTFL